MNGQHLPFRHAGSCDAPYVLVMTTLLTLSSLAAASSTPLVPCTAGFRCFSSKLSGSNSTGEAVCITASTPAIAVV